MGRGEEVVVTEMSFPWLPATRPRIRRLRAKAATTPGRLRLAMAAVVLAALLAGLAIGALDNGAARRSQRRRHARRAADGASRWPVRVAVGRRRHRCDDVPHRRRRAARPARALPRRPARREPSARGARTSRARVASRPPRSPPSRPSSRLQRPRGDRARQQSPGLPGRRRLPAPGVGPHARADPAGGRTAVRGRGAAPRRPSARRHGLGRADRRCCSRGRRRAGGARARQVFARAPDAPPLQRPAGRRDRRARGRHGLGLDRAWRRRTARSARAQRDGSDSVQILSAARILALRAQADESLALVARGGGDQYVTDFDNVDGLARTAERPAGRRGAAGARGRARPPPSQALTPDWRDLRAAHMRVAPLEADGQFGDAVHLAVGAGAREAALADRAQPRVRRADRRCPAALRRTAAGDARSALAGLAVGIPLLARCLRGARARRPPDATQRVPMSRRRRQLSRPVALAALAGGARRLRHRPPTTRSATALAALATPLPPRRRVRLATPTAPASCGDPTASLRPPARCRRPAPCRRAASWRGSAGAAGSSPASTRTRCSSAYLQPVDGPHRGLRGRPRCARSRGRSSATRTASSCAR